MRVLLGQMVMQCRIPRGKHIPRRSGNTGRLYDLFGALQVAMFSSQSFCPETRSITSLQLFFRSLAVGFVFVTIILPQDAKYHVSTAVFFEPCIWLCFRHNHFARRREVSRLYSYFFGALQVALFSSQSFCPETRSITSLQRSFRSLAGGFVFVTIILPGDTKYHVSTAVFSEPCIWLCFLTTHHFPLTIHHSPFTTHHSPLTTPHSPHHSPFTQSLLTKPRISYPDIIIQRMHLHAFAFYLFDECGGYAMIAELFGFFKGNILEA